jgi:hypothetical protein
MACIEPQKALYGEPEFIFHKFSCTVGATTAEALSNLSMVWHGKGPAHQTGWQPPKIGIKKT